MFFPKLNLFRFIRSPSFFIRRSGYVPLREREEADLTEEEDNPIYSVKMEPVYDINRHMIKTNYEKIREKCRNLTAIVHLETAAAKVSDERVCFHSPRYLIDLTEDSGDVVCTECGAVVMERGPLSPYLNQPGFLSQKNYEDVTYSPDIAHYNVLGSHVKYDLLAQETIRDALENLKIEATPTMLYSICELLKELAAGLNVSFHRFVSQKKYRNHMAYGFFSYLSSVDIFRHPDEICSFFSVSYMKLLQAENVNEALRSEWNYKRKPPIYCRPSQLVFILCANFNLTYKVSHTIYMIVKDIESLCYGIRPEKIVYSVMCEVLNYLNPTHKDKSKITLLESFRSCFLIGKVEKNECFIPGVTIVKHMSEKNLI